jgi:hypothetical protein
MDPKVEKMVDDVLAAILEVIKDNGVEPSPDRVGKLRGLLIVYSDLLTQDADAKKTNNKKSRPGA